MSTQIGTGVTSKKPRRDAVGLPLFAATRPSRVGNSTCQLLPIGSKKTGKLVANSPIPQNSMATFTKLLSDKSREVTPHGRDKNIANIQLTSENRADIPNSFIDPLQKKLQVPVEKVAARLEVSDPLGLLGQTKHLQKKMPSILQSETSQSFTLDNSKSQFNKLLDEAGTRRVNRKSDAEDASVDVTRSKATPPKEKFAETPISMSTQRAPVNETNTSISPLIHTNRNSANLHSTKTETTSKSSAPNTPPVNFSDLLVKLGAELKQRMVNGDRTLDVMIATPMLGKLKIELVEQEGKMQATFIAESPALRDQLLRDRDRLQSLLPVIDGKTAEVFVSTDPSSQQSAQYQSTSRESHETTSNHFSDMARNLNHFEPVAERRVLSPNATREWIG